MTQRADTGNIGAIMLSLSDCSHGNFGGVKVTAILWLFRLLAVVLGVVGWTGLSQQALAQHSTCNAAVERCGG